jgi:hypothetical protein
MLINSTFDVCFRWVAFDFCVIPPERVRINRTNIVVYVSLGGGESRVVCVSEERLSEEEPGTARYGGTTTGSYPPVDLLPRFFSGPVFLFSFAPITLAVL